MVGWERGQRTAWILSSIHPLACNILQNNNCISHNPGSPPGSAAVTPYNSNKNSINCLPDCSSCSVATSSLISSQCQSSNSLSRLFQDVCQAIWSHVQGLLQCHSQFLCPRQFYLRNLSCWIMKSAFRTMPTTQSIFSW